MVEVCIRLESDPFYGVRLVLGYLNLLAYAQRFGILSARKTFFHTPSTKLHKLKSVIEHFFPPNNFQYNIDY